MTKKKILAVLSDLLGNKTLSNYYLEVFKQMSDYEVNYFYITGEDYSRYSAKGLGRFSSAFRLADIAKRKFQDCNPGQYDVLFINGYEIAHGLLNHVNNSPTILALDVVPRLVHHLLVKTHKNILLKFRSLILSVLMKAEFDKLFSNIDVFLPMTKWCGDALMKDYGISKEKIFATYAPADLERWKPAFCSDDREIRILFVGNHFERKGGDLLLDIFNKRFEEQGIKLILVSSDPQLKKEELPQGVELYQHVSHEKMVHIFQLADIFVFPTRKEYLGVVVTEACCVGLPVIARDVGGLREIIIDGYNGYLMPYESSEEQWAEKIQFLIDHPEERKRMGENSRKIAEKMFGMEKFRDIVSKAFDLVSKE